MSNAQFGCGCGSLVVADVEKSGFRINVVDLTDEAGFMSVFLNVKISNKPNDDWHEWLPAGCFPFRPGALHDSCSHRVVAYGDMPGSALAWKYAVSSNLPSFRDGFSKFLLLDRHIERIIGERDNIGVYDNPNSWTSASVFYLAGKSGFQPIGPFPNQVTFNRNINGHPGTLFGKISVERNAIGSSSLPQGHKNQNDAKGRHQNADYSNGVSNSSGGGGSFGGQCGAPLGAEIGIIVIMCVITIIIIYSGALLVGLGTNSFAVFGGYLFLLVGCCVWGVFGLWIISCEVVVIPI